MSALDIVLAEIIENHNENQKLANHTEKRRGMKPKKQKTKKAEPMLNEPPLCNFCNLPSTLKIGRRYYLCTSKTRPELKICNACKSYEHRNGILVPRGQRKANRSRKRKLNEEAAARKKMFFDPLADRDSVKEVEVESEPEFEIPKECVHGLQPPAHWSPPPGRAENLFIPNPTTTHEISFPLRDSIADYLDIEAGSDRDTDLEDDLKSLRCHICWKDVRDVSNLVLCGGCVGLFHSNCFHERFGTKKEPTVGPMTVCCEDHQNFSCQTKHPGQTATCKFQLPSLEGFYSDAAISYEPRSPTVFTPDYVNTMDYEMLFSSQRKKLLQTQRLEKMGSRYVLSEW